MNIDGIEITVQSGTKLLAVALDAGINIPYACYVPDADPPVHQCKLCVVEANGNVVTACTEEVTDGMEVITNSPELERLRRKRLHFPG